MTRRRRNRQRGSFTDRTEPVWGPLLRLLPEDVCDFMWMGEVALADGSRPHLYKHRWTRRYLCLGRDGRGFLALGDGRFEEVALGELVATVFAGQEPPVRVEGPD